jgi:hypothetical protein
LRKYIGIVRGKYFPHILIIGGALEVPSYRNRDVLLESAPFYKNWALASFFKREYFVLNTSF